MGFAPVHVRATREPCSIHPDGSRRTSDLATICRHGCLSQSVFYNMCLLDHLTLPHRSNAKVHMCAATVQELALHRLAILQTAGGPPESTRQWLWKVHEKSKELPREALLGQEVSDHSTNPAGPQTFAQKLFENGVFFSTGFLSPSGSAASTGDLRAKLACVVLSDIDSLKTLGSQLAKHQELHLLGLLGRWRCDCLRIIRC